MGSVPSFLHLVQGCFLLALYKHHFISSGTAPHLGCPPPPTAPSSLLAQFNFQPWYFFLARDNLRWKQFHRLVTHRVIIISIRAPGARAEGREQRVDPARQSAALVGGGAGAPSSCLGSWLSFSQGSGYTSPRSLCVCRVRGRGGVRDGWTWVYTAGSLTGEGALGSSHLRLGSGRGSEGEEGRRAHVSLLWRTRVLTCHSVSLGPCGL